MFMFVMLVLLYVFHHIKFPVQSCLGRSMSFHFATFGSQYQPSIVPGMPKSWKNVSLDISMEQRRASGMEVLEG